MKKISLKLWLAMVTLVLLVLGSFSLTINFLFAGFYTNQRIVTLEQQAKEVASNLSTNSTSDELKSELQQIHYTLGQLAVVVDIHGQIIPESLQGRGMSMMGSLTMHENALASIDLNQVFAGETVHSTVQLTDGTSAVAVATPIKSANGKALGAVILSSPMAQLQETIRSFRNLLYYLMAAAVLLATSFALWLSGTLTTPLIEMNNVARKISRGDFADRVTRLSDDEIGDLGRSLNKLAEDLDMHIELLSREKEQLSGIIDSIGDAVVTLDDDGNIVQANTPACELWQDEDERKELIMSHLRQVLEMVARDNQPVEQDFNVGTQVLNIQMQPLREVEGQGGGVAVLRDITAAQKTEKARRELMASVSHELRTPIHLIQGQLEALSDGLVPPKDQNSFLERALGETERMGRLVAELQEISRLDQGFPVVQNTMDLGDLALEIGEKFRSKIEAAGINLEIKSSTVRILGDRDRLTQVFINLIDNCIRYTPLGGSITISVSQDGKIAVLNLTDTGTGIDTEDLPKIWESFYRADPAEKGHMGLGLAIVKRIIEAHGGTVAARSEIGKGSVFEIILPALG